MGRFDPKYTDEQKAAVVAAIVDQGTHPTHVVAAAAAGELAGLDPFEFNLNTAKSLAGEERRRRRGTDARVMRERGRPEERIDAWVRRGLAVMEAELEASVRAQERGELTDDQIRRIGLCAKAGREIRGLVRGLPTTSSGGRLAKAATDAKRPGDPDADGQPDPASDVVHELMDRLGLPPERPGVTSSKARTQAA